MDNIEIDIQNESTSKDVPTTKELTLWTLSALETKKAEITIRIVDEEESGRLNYQYRQKKGPTNVLSFPFRSLLKPMLHGDIVICAPLVSKEAIEQEKSLQAHWAHLTIHGILHLQGYDHIKNEDAKKMQQREIDILLTLGLPDPY